MARQENEAIHELAAAYALDSLDDRDRRAFEEHLAECERCEEDVRSLGAAAAGLAVAVEAPPPPLELRERLLERALEERPKVVRLRRRIPSWGYVGGAAAAAAACAAIGLGLWAASLHGSLDRERDARRSQERLTAVLADPAARHVPLQGARGSLVVGPGGSAALVVRGLPQPAPGRTYEAWIIRAGRAEPAGLFGDGSATMVLKGRVSKGAVVGVTMERAGGSGAPTMKPLLSAKA